jgi:hypothetical protein
MITIKHRHTGKVMVEGNTYQECLEKLRDEEGVIQLMYANLRFADLAGANLAGANLTRADMSGANLTKANLHFADLTEADLRFANLTKADMTRADLTGANLTKANLTEANMTEVNIDYASWPLWCSSLNVKVDRNILAQLAYHLLRLMPEKERGKSLKKLANEFHEIVQYNLPKL